MKKIIKRKIYIGLLLSCVICSFGCREKEDVFLEENPQELQEENKEVEDTKEIDSFKEDNQKKQQEENEEVSVFVCGAVENPGVYSLENGKRIGDAIEMAGGMKDFAAQDCLNQAEPLIDGQMLKVLTWEETQQEENEDTEEEKGLVNLNTATEEQLMTLSGIGQSKAKSIVTYREENGQFGAIEEVMNITGIKEGVFNKIKDDISVD